MFFVIRFVRGSRNVSAYFFFSSRRRHTRCGRDWSSDVCSSDLHPPALVEECSGAVAPLLDVGGEGRADEHGAHLLRDGAERRSQNLELDLHDRVSLSVLFPSLTPTHPGGIQQVAPSS